MDRRAAPLECAAGGVAVHGPERPGRKDHVGRGGLAEQCRPHGEDAHRRARLVRAQVEGRADEDVPEALDLHVGGAEPAEQRAEGLAVVRGSAPQCDQRPDNLKALPRGQVAVPEDGERRAADGGDGRILADHGQLEPPSPVGAAFADALEEGEVLREAAERDVLPVVGRRRRVAVALRERLDGAAQRRPRLGELDIVTGIDELERGGEARQPAADDGDLHVVPRVVACA